MVKARVAIVRTSPATVLADYHRLMNLAGYRDVLSPELDTALKINISWHSFFPGSSTTPWQLEGVIRAMKRDGYDPALIHGCHNRTVVIDFLRGITGFGSGLIAIPLLAHFMPLTFVVPMVLVMDLMASIVLSRHVRAQVCWQEIRYLLPTTIVGMLVGTALLVSLPREPLLLSLGLFVIFFGVRYVFNVHSENPINVWWSVPAGLSGGLIGALFGTGGPPYVVYLAHRLHDKTQLRSTLSGLFMLDGAFRFITYLAMGLLIQPDMFNALLLGLPLMAAGLYLGNKVHLGISHRQQLAIIGALLLLSGASLLWKAWSPALS